MRKRTKIMTKLHFLFLKKDSFDTLNIEVNFDLKKKVNTNIDDKLFYKGSGGITLMKFLQRFWDILRWLFGVSTLAVLVFTEFIAFIFCIAAVIGIFFAFFI